MKKLIFLLIALTGITFASQAQVNVNINLGTQPAWGPTGYDHVDYYYIPDIESYYYVPGQVYIYKDGNTWHRSRALPARYTNFNVYNSHKVVINGVNRPYLQHAKYRQEYANYRGQHDQTPIRDSKEEKYFVNRYHPQHAEWQKSHPGNSDYGNGNHGNGDHENGDHGNSNHGNKGGNGHGHGKN